MVGAGGSSRLVEPRPPTPLRLEALLEPEARRAQRGGGWKDTAESLRSANRGRRAPDFRLEDYGFRLALSLD